MTQFDLIMAELKGTVTAKLDNIEQNITEMKVKCSATRCEFGRRIQKLELKPSFSINPIGWIMSLLGLRR